MSMKKYFLFCLFVFSGMLTSCAAKQESAPKESPAVRQTISDKEVVWTIEDTETVPEENIEKLNQALYKKGYDVAVRFDYISSEWGEKAEEYQKELIRKIENQETDIVFCGWGYDSRPGWMENFIRKGYFLPLDDWLESEQGKQVYRLYEEEIWQAGKVDGVTYTLPNESVYYRPGSMVSFNTDYVPQELISSWDGTWEDLYRVVEQMDVPKGIMPIAGPPYWFSFADREDPSAYFVFDGLVYDAKKAVVSIPFSLDIFHSFLTFLHRCNEKGYLSKIKMGESDYTDQEIKDIGNLKYAINLNESWEGAEEQIYCEKTRFCVENSLGTRTAVCANSTKTEEALTLLKALRTEDDLANILVWGSSDRQKVAGKDGELPDDNPLARGYNLGLYDGIFQQSDLPSDPMREYKKEQLQSSYRIPSALAGFYPDYSGMEKELKAYRKDLDQLFNCWKEKDFQKAYQNAVKTLKPYEDTIVKRINKQIKRWQKSYGKN